MNGLIDYEKLLNGLLHERLEGGRNLSEGKGCLVIVADIDGKAAERTVEKIISQSCPDKCPTPIAVQCDVGNENQVKALVDKAVQAGKRLDVILNNAKKIWDLTMRVNCKGVWWGCKYAIQSMLNNPTDESKGLKRGGSIINTASFVAKLGAATPQLAYTASKGAVLAMSRELAMVHARDGIRVNALCPLVDPDPSPNSQPSNGSSNRGQLLIWMWMTIADQRTPPNP